MKGSYQFIDNSVVRIHDGRAIESFTPIVGSSTDLCHDVYYEPLHRLAMPRLRSRTLELLEYMRNRRCIVIVEQIPRGV